MGLWSLGGHIAAGISQQDVATLPGWRGVVFGLPGLTAANPGVGGRLLLGLTYFLPLLAVVLLASMFWELLFAKLRHRRVDAGWLMTAWLFTLLLPATLPAPLAVLGISFAVVIGKQIFGGTGRYIVSPAVLGIVFLSFGYPAYFAGEQIVPLSSSATTWAIVAAGGIDAAQELSLSWAQVFLGVESTTFGTASALASLLGAAYLVYKGAASARVVLGALGGMLLATMLIGAIPSDDSAWQIPWHWHLALGSFAFGIAFVATDPTTSALTPPGRWLQGGMIGLLTVLIRVLNPAHPEGSLFAIVLGCLFTPLIDHVVVQVQLARWRNRTKEAA